MATPFLADGTTLQVDDGASSAYVAITQVLTITPPSEEVGGYDATTLTSTAGTMVKAPLSRKEPGTFGWSMWNDATEKLRMMSLRGVAHNFKITYPNSAVDTIPGWISKVETDELENQSPGKLKVTVMISGAVTRV
jgi:hypothetical protein